MGQHIGPETAPDQGLQNVRVLIVGRRRFSRPLSRLLADVSLIDLVGIAKGLDEAAQIATALKPDTVLVEPMLTHAAEHLFSRASVVVLAPRVTEPATTDADARAALLPLDLVTAAILLASSM